MLCLFNFSELFHLSCHYILLSWTVRCMTPAVTDTLHFNAHKSWTLLALRIKRLSTTYLELSKRPSIIETKHAIRRRLWENWEELYVIYTALLPTWSLETRWPSCLSDQLVVICHSVDNQLTVCRQPARLANHATPYSIVYGAYTYSAVQYTSIRKCINVDSSSLAGLRLT